MELISAYFTSGSKDDEDDTPNGPCKIHYYNGFDYYISLDESGIELIAQDYELSIYGIPLPQLIKEGLIELPVIEDPIKIVNE
jgi:hypothetical protein